jgi:hypothetical protein
MKTNLWLTSDWVVTVIGVTVALLLAVLWINRRADLSDTEGQSPHRRHLVGRIAAFGVLGDFSSKLAFLPLVLYLVAGARSDAPVWLYVITTLILVLASYAFFLAREKARSALRLSSHAAAP